MSIPENHHAVSFWAPDKRIGNDAKFSEWIDALDIAVAFVKWRFVWLAIGVCIGTSAGFLLAKAVIV